MNMVVRAREDVLIERGGRSNKVARAVAPMVVWEVGSSSSVIAVCLCGAGLNAMQV